MFRRKSGENDRRQPQLMQGQDDITFKRSRTLQGTTSSQVRSINPKRAGLQSERAKKQALSRRRKVLFGFFGLVIVFFSLSWYVMTQYSDKVGEIGFSPEPKSKVNEANYRTHIDTYLAQNPMQKFQFLLNEKQLGAYISQKMPEVESVKSTGTLSNSLDIELRLRQPVASWKSDAASVAYVDERGKIFFINYYQKPPVVIVDESGIKSAQGKTSVVSERLLRFLGRLIFISSPSGIGEITSATLPKNTTREIDIKVKNVPFVIKTHIDRDPAATAEDISRVSGYLKNKNITPTYIDVRVAGRAFYQ